MRPRARRRLLSIVRSDCNERPRSELWIYGAIFGFVLRGVCLFEKVDGLERFLAGFAERIFCILLIDALKTAFHILRIDSGLDREIAQGSSSRPTVHFRRASAAAAASSTPRETAMRPYHAVRLQDAVEPAVASFLCCPACRIPYNPERQNANVYCPANRPPRRSQVSCLPKCFKRIQTRMKPKMPVQVDRPVRFAGLLAQRSLDADCNIRSRHAARPYSARPPLRAEIS